MRQFTGLAVGTAVAAMVFGTATVISLVGCSPGKELPDASQVAREPEPATPADPFGKVPRTSDPAAKAVADRVIKAISQGQPERLAKARTSRSVAKGKVTFPQGFFGNAERLTTNADRVIETAWPDHGRVNYKYEQGPFRTKQFGLNRPLGWMLDDLNNSMPMSPALCQLLENGLLAEQWLPTGIALTDPTAVFFDPGARKTEAVTTFKVGLGVSQPIYLLAVDDKTDLIRRIESNPMQDGKQVKKITSIPKHQLYEGLMLPAEMVNYDRGDEVENWAFTAWEFPEKYDTEIFNPPTPKK